MFKVLKNQTHLRLLERRDAAVTFHRARHDVFARIEGIGNAHFRRFRCRFSGRCGVG